MWVSSITILCETFFFSMLVSLFTVGVGASTTKGALLSPFKHLILNLPKIKRLNRLWIIAVEAKEEYRRKGRNTKHFDRLIEKIEFALLYNTFLWKPIILCVNCMPSFWGTIIFWCLPYNHSQIWVWLIGIPVATAINYMTAKYRN